MHNSVACMYSIARQHDNKRRHTLINHLVVQLQLFLVSCTRLLHHYSQVNVGLKDVYHLTTQACMCMKRNSAGGLAVTCTLPVQIQVPSFSVDYQIDLVTKPCMSVIHMSLNSIPIHTPLFPHTTLPLHPPLSSLPHPFALPLPFDLSLFFCSPSLSLTCTHNTTYQQLLELCQNTSLDPVAVLQPFFRPSPSDQDAEVTKASIITSVTSTVCRISHTPHIL